MCHLYFCFVLEESVENVRTFCEGKKNHIFYLSLCLNSFSVETHCELKNVFVRMNCWLSFIFKTKVLYFQKGIEWGSLCVPTHKSE